MQAGKRSSYNGELCTIRYRGPVDGTKGEWLGVEWDEPTRGKHNGEVGGKRYFRCRSREARCASFIRPTRKAEESRTFLEALRFKYGSEHANISFQVGAQPPVEQPIRFGAKEAEEVGFEKIAKRLANLYQLRVVSLDGLCVHQPESDLTQEILETCPNITELDLSRNLIETFNEVAAICQQLEHLRILRLDGNRFSKTHIENTDCEDLRNAFKKITELHLDSTLLDWTEVSRICPLFSNLRTLSISSNELEALESTDLHPNFPNITTINLESNHFRSVSDLSALSLLPSLQKLNLRFNSISTISQQSSSPLTFLSLTELDLSHNSLNTWTPLNVLPTHFPSLSHLRVAHDPLYSSLRSPLGRTLTSDDGYMLTIARLPRLKTLNHSAVTEKDRLNAETYYLSLIAQELSLAAEDRGDDIKKQHPRWDELCREFGEPLIKREKDFVDPRSLAARLIGLEVVVSDSAAEALGITKVKSKEVENVPKRLNVYAVLGLIVKAFGSSKVSPGLSLWLITDEWEEVEGDRVRREVRLIPETRGIGTFVEGRVGRLRLDYSAPAGRGSAAYVHAMNFAFLRSDLQCRNE